MFSLVSSPFYVAGRTNLKAWCVFGLIDYYDLDVSYINDSPKIFVELFKVGRISSHIAHELMVFLILRHVQKGSVIQSQVRNSKHHDADAGVENVSDSLFWAFVGENQSLQTLPVSGNLLGEVGSEELRKSKGA
jgi:hypothetical protein